MRVNAPTHSRACKSSYNASRSARRSLQGFQRPAYGQEDDPAIECALRRSQTPISTTNPNAATHRERPNGRCSSPTSIGRARHSNRGQVPARSLRTLGLEAVGKRSPHTRTLDHSRRSSRRLRKGVRCSAHANTRLRQLATYWPRASLRWPPPPHLPKRLSMRPKVLPCHPPQPPQRRRL